MASVDYDPQADAHAFTKFLKRILPSEALRRFDQRVVGYAATGEVSEEVFVILHGVGANGSRMLAFVTLRTAGTKSP